MKEHAFLFYEDFLKVSDFFLTVRFQRVADLHCSNIIITFSV